MEQRAKSLGFFFLRPGSGVLQTLFGMLLAFACWAPVQAQVDNVMVYGTVKDMSSAKKLGGVTVTVYKNGAKLTDVITNAGGKYEVNLDYGAQYKVECAIAGYVGKNITIDTRNVPEEERLGGHGMNIDFTLLAELSGVDFSVLMEPFGMAAYDGAASNFSWDMEYTNRMRAAQQRLMKEYEDRKKRATSREEDYAKYMEQGDKAMGATEYQKAVDSFNSALEAIPNDAVATAKLSDARMRLDEQEGEKKREEQFANLVKEADQFFGKKDYEAARSKYTAALDVKENEAHPTARLKEIDVILKELAEQAEAERLARELDEKYKAAVDAGDVAFKADQLADARAKYNEALGLKPTESYPKSQLDAIAQREAELADLAEQERQAKELEEKYQAAITAGDAAFKADRLDEARGKFNEALELKPKEKYPQDQLDAIAKREAELADQAEQERLAKELEEKYQAAITAGDAALAADRFDDARARFNEALELKPQEKYPKDRLDAIAKREAELAQQAEAERLAKEIEEKYQAAITAADAAFGADRFDEARGKFNEALELKPQEKYPKDRLDAIAQREADLAAQAEAEQAERERNERYQAAVERADAAFDGARYEEAQVAYTEASGIKPDERHPKDRLAAIAARLEELAEAAAEEQRLREKEERYARLMDEGAEAVANDALADARSKFQDASTIKPEEDLPKKRIAEIDALIAQRELEAEEERRRMELQARYDELIARADGAFASEDWSEALKDYKDALQLKEEEAWPKKRIAEVEQRMDAAAQARAEAERTEREMRERDERYAAHVATGDMAFQEERFDEAKRAFRDALAEKPEESYPNERIAAIDALLAERESAAEQARRAEAEAAEAQAREEEERRRREAAEAEMEARINAMLTEADAAFDSQEYSRAREQYNAVLSERPDQPRASARVQEIDALLAAMDDERRQAEREAEEQRKREAEEAEAARLAALNAERSAQEEAERLRREQLDAEAARLADLEAERKREEEERKRRELADSEAERERIAREQQREDRYRNAILEADQALADEDYDQARGLYAQSLDIKPEETYPQTKIEQIDKILEDIELRRQEEELAAQRARDERAERRAKQTPTVDTRKEQEAERFLREAREREEAEKWERIKKLRAEREEQELERQERSADRRQTGTMQRREYERSSDKLYRGSEDMRLRNAEELEAFREQQEREEAARRQRSREAGDQAYGAKLDLESDIMEVKRHMEDRHADNVADVADRTSTIRTEHERVSDRADRRRDQARDEVRDKADAHQEMQSDRAAAVDRKRSAVEDAKARREAQETQLARASQQARERRREELASISTVPERDPAAGSRSKLAQDYPPGVTEESYTEGNKVIIRRVVVNGNRADEFSKVIAKWGTFYFKNGQSITELVWNQETER